MSSVVKVNRHALTLTNLDKIFFPRDGITKGDVISYYHTMAPYMLPFMRNRLLSMLRYPQGIGKEGFFHKNAPDYFPSWITTKRIKKQNGSVDYVICNNAATLVYLANFAVLTPHLWLSKADKPNYPDHIIFDLDPSKESDFDSVKWAAIVIRDFFEEHYSLKTFVMTTGSKGVHIWLPIRRQYNFDKVRAFARACAQDLVDRYPKKLTLEIRKNKRRGRIFVDFLRNAFGQTAVSPYAIRAHDGAPIAMPVSWKELDKLKTSQDFTLKKVPNIVAKRDDPWKAMAKSAQSLAKYIS
jgi:bifunctional non-homologous end joining protein LigD